MLRVPDWSTTLRAFLHSDVKWCCLWLWHQKVGFPPPTASPGLSSHLACVWWGICRRSWQSKLLCLLALQISRGPHSLLAPTHRQQVPGWTFYSERRLILRPMLYWFFSGPMYSPSPSHFCEKPQKPKVNRSVRYPVCCLFKILTACDFFKKIPGRKKLPQQSQNQCHRCRMFHQSQHW